MAHSVSSGWEPSGDPFRDPLLLLAPSLFVFTSALVLTHLFPLLMGPGRSPGQPPPLLRRLHGPHPTAPPGQTLLRQHLPDNGLPQPRRLLRLPWPSASTSGSRDRIQYQVGADYRFQQGIPPPEMGGPSGPGEEPDPEVISAWLLPVDDYLGIPGVEDATRVAVF